MMTQEEFEGVRQLREEIWQYRLQILRLEDTIRLYDKKISTLEAHISKLRPKTKKKVSRKNRR